MHVPHCRLSTFDNLGSASINRNVRHCRLSTFDNLGSALSTVDHFMYNSSYPCCPITVIYSVLSIQHSNFSINWMYTRVPRVRA